MPETTPPPLTAEDNALMQALSEAGAMCGDCGDEPGDRTCPDCEKCLRWYVDAARTAGWGPVTELEQQSRRYRIAWRMARTRALSAGGAADRYATRAHDFQTAAQDGLVATLGMQIERDAALARVAELERERGEVIELTWRPQDILLGDDDTADLMLTAKDGRPANWRLDPDQRRGLADDLAETDDDGRRLHLPWARRLDADDLEGLLGEIADAASGDDDLTTLAEVEHVISRWRVVADAEHAHATVPGPDAEDGEPGTKAPCDECGRAARPGCGHCPRCDTCENCHRCAGTGCTCACDGGGDR